MSHIVESCLLTKLNGGLSWLHSADEFPLFRVWPIMGNDTHTRRRSAACQNDGAAVSGSRNMKNMVHGRSFLRQMLHRGHQFISYRHLRLADTLMWCHACTGRMLLLVLNCGMVSQPCCVSWTVLWHCWLGHTTRKSLQNDLWCVNWDAKPCCAVSSADQVTCTA